MISISAIGQHASGPPSRGERGRMATSTAVELIAVSLEDRRVLRALRAPLELSRATIEQRARVGIDYMKHLESGQYPRLEATRLRRVVQVLQQAAARRPVSADLTGVPGVNVKKTSLSPKPR